MADQQATFSTDGHFRGGNVREALLWTRRTLGQRLHFGSNESARELAIEAEVLVAHVVRSGRAALFGHPERMLDAGQSAKLVELVERRLAHEPVAYLIGRREFYGLELKVDRRALIPRPETELSVERAIGEAKRMGGAIKVADVGTGSGAIAIALAKHLPRAKVYAVDISPDALELAAVNCLEHGVAEQVALLHGNLLAPLPERVQIVVANLPYVSPEEMGDLEPEVRDHEPRLALVAGDHGLEHYNRLLEQAPGYLSPSAVLIFEIAPHQVNRLVARTRATLAGAELGVDKDLAGRDRVFWVRVP